MPAASFRTNAAKRAREEDEAGGKVRRCGETNGVLVNFPTEPNPNHKVSSKCNSMFL